MTKFTLFIEYPHIFIQLFNILGTSFLKFLMFPNKKRNCLNSNNKSIILLVESKICPYLLIHCVANTTGSTSKPFLPLLRIKLKNSVKEMLLDGCEFLYIKVKFVRFWYSFFA